MTPPRKKAPGPKKPPAEQTPPSPPETEPGDGGEASSTASSKGSAPSGFVSEPGPDFEPGQEPEPAPEQSAELHALPGLAPEWEERAVMEILVAKGELLHLFGGVADDDWRYTLADLKSIAPPLCRILNRHAVTAAAAGAQDPIALAIGVSGYAIRSARERQAVLQALEAEPEQPITGVPAPEGAQPPPDFEPGFQEVEPETPPAPAGPASGLDWRLA